MKRKKEKKNKKEIAKNIKHVDGVSNNIVVDGWHTYGR